MKQDYVTFYSPGTFIAERRTLEVASWNVAKALEMLPNIEERHGARPYGFQFSTKRRGWRDLEPKEVKRSGMYYVNCRVETLAEIEDRDDPRETTLLQNMKTNGWEKMVSPRKGWAWSQPLNDGDTVL
jgi:hypothetical protein